MNQILAIAFSLLVYLFLVSAYYGWGQVASYILGIANQRKNSPLSPVWLGWAFTLFIFEVCHFFLPITAYVSIPVLTFGVVIFILNFRRVMHHYQKQINYQSLVIVIVTIVLAAWIASKAMLPPTNYDSGLYHFNAIRWINTYPIIPGLGNLHGRLALNQSFFIYIAALNFFPLFGFGRSIANSFLLLLVLATLAPSILAIIKRPALLRKEHPFRYASDIFIFSIIVSLALTSNGVASPSPDLASTLLQLTMFVMLAHGIAEWVAGQKDQNYRVMVLIVLAGTAVTIKLSNLAFSMVIICFAILYVWNKTRLRFKMLCHLLLPIFILFFVWGLRGFILSGTPLYPTTIGYVHVEWAMPLERIDREAQSIFSWARQPGTNSEEVLNNWSWISPWLLRIYLDTPKIIYLLSLTALFIPLTLIVSLLKKGIKPHVLEWVIFLPSIISLVYWFFTAPDPRFANAIFYLAAVCSILIFLIYLQEMKLGSLYIPFLCFVFLIGNFQYLPYALDKSNLLISTSGWYVVKEVSLEKKITLSGLIVYVPTTGDQCWDSPLPSTSVFNEKLRLIDPIKITSGFTVND